MNTGLVKKWAMALVVLGGLALPGSVLAVSGDVPEPGTHPTAHGDGAADGDGAAHGTEGHGDDHGHGHVPHFEDINWVHGFLGEKEGVEPGLLWRAPGTPIPLGALLLNTAILFWLLVKFGGPVIAKGLADRKKRVVAGMDAAADMRADAEKQLEHYQGKLDRIDQEIEHIKQQMKEQGESERKRVLAEAKERRESMERDARLLIEQELKAAREALVQETVHAAVASAREKIARELNPGDQERLAADFMQVAERTFSAENPS